MSHQTIEPKQIVIPREREKDHFLGASHVILIDRLCFSVSKEKIISCNGLLLDHTAPRGAQTQHPIQSSLMVPVEEFVWMKTVFENLSDSKNPSIQIFEVLKHRAGAKGKDAMALLIFITLLKDHHARLLSLYHVFEKLMEAAIKFEI